MRSETCLCEDIRTKIFFNFFFFVKNIGAARALKYTFTCCFFVDIMIPKVSTECLALRKHAYSNILKILPQENENFQIKILIFFIFLLKNIDCGYLLEPHRRGGSNEYP